MQLGTLVFACTLHSQEVETSMCYVVCKESVRELTHFYISGFFDYRLFSCRHFCLRTFFQHGAAGGHRPPAVTDAVRVRKRRNTY